MSRPFSLLVFDWDGTLMDSEVHIVASMQGAMRSLGMAPLATDIVRGIIGLGMREAICSLYPEADDVFIGQFADFYRKAYMQEGQGKQGLFPGAKKVLLELERSGYLLAVATGKGRAGLDKVMKETGLSGCFHATRCADESYSKPHPAMLEELMAFCGVDAGQTLMIGDTTFDLLMARNAGVASVGVSYGVHSVSNLLAENPLTILDHITDLPIWLSRLGADVGMCTQSALKT